MLNVTHGLRRTWNTQPRLMRSSSSMIEVTPERRAQASTEKRAIRSTCNGFAEM